VASLFAQSTQPATEAFTLINSDYSARNRVREPEAEEEDPRVRPIWHGYVNALGIENSARNLFWQAIIGQQMENPVCCAGQIRRRRETFYSGMTSIALIEAVGLLDADGRIGPIGVLLRRNVHRIRGRRKDPGQQRICPKN